MGKRRNRKPAAGGRAANAPADDDQTPRSFVLSQSSATERLMQVRKPASGQAAVEEQGGLDPLPHSHRCCAFGAAACRRRRHSGALGGEREQIGRRISVGAWLHAQPGSRHQARLGVGRHLGGTRRPHRVVTPRTTWLMIPPSLRQGVPRYRGAPSSPSSSSSSPPPPPPPPAPI